MGWTIPKYKYYISSIRFWNRLCESDNSLTKYIFEWNLQNFQNNTFESHMCNIFDSLNMLSVFESPSVINIDKVKERILDVMHEDWQNKIPFKPKLRTFALIKQEIQPDKYLFSSSKCKRSLYCQLRIGILPLEIETGRYFNLNLDERICKI